MVATSVPARDGRYWSRARWRGASRCRAARWRSPVAATETTSRACFGASSSAATTLCSWASSQGSVASSELSLLIRSTSASMTPICCPGEVTRGDGLADQLARLGEEVAGLGRTDGVPVPPGACVFLLHLGALVRLVGAGSPSSREQQRRHRDAEPPCDPPPTVRARVALPPAPRAGTGPGDVELSRRLRLADRELLSATLQPVGMGVSRDERGFRLTVIRRRPERRGQDAGQDR